MTGEDVIIHEKKTSMTDGIQDCSASSGVGYVDVTYSSPKTAGSISLENLGILQEF